MSETKATEWSKEEISEKPSIPINPQLFVVKQKKGKQCPEVWSTLKLFSFSVSTILDLPVVLVKSAGNT